ncbi:EamA family transporter [Zoogloeaceae bacterium G21618-S1]|uniref:EamA family transporter n=1 Tax=Denitromonas halophila TaxID=1629404 RepID=A0A557QZ77_9RHOO|nr:EamA family transporter [Denitromonas halophila]MCZ4303192.1 EamA family transporter [Zoogloeaceae bacterium G21618-S1]TVO58210.1 EamA family transporter [Denitromonas halophila]
MKTTQSQSQWRDAVLTALAPIIWGTTYIVTTEWLPPDRPFTAALLRALPAGLLLVLWCRRLPAVGFWGRLLVLSALNIAVFQALLFVAAYRLPGGLAAVVGAIQPLLVMALAWAVDQQRPVRLAVWASVAGVLGMAALLLSPDAVWSPVGIAAALAGAACMAAGTFLARRWRPELPVLAFTGWQLLLGGVMLAPVAWAIDPPLPTLSAANLAGYAYLAVFGALVSYALWFRGVARLSPVAASSLGLLSPLTAVLVGWALLDESMRGLSLVGLVVVLGSVLVVQRAMAAPGGVPRPVRYPSSAPAKA